MPSLQYWFTGTALFPPVSFAISILIGLVGIKDMISGRWIIAFMVLAFLTLAAWWTAAKQEEESADLKNTLHSIAQDAPIIEALRRSQTALQGYEQAAAISRRILNQYNLLMEGIAATERMGGKTIDGDRLAAAEHIILELRTAISGNIQLFDTKDGRGLIIKTAPNTFRVTFPVPMRVVPTIIFYNLPDGLKETIIEKSNVGFTVVFTPMTNEIEKFPGFEASADF